MNANITDKQAAILATLFANEGKSMSAADLGAAGATLAAMEGKRLIARHDSFAVANGWAPRSYALTTRGRIIARRLGK